MTLSEARANIGRRVVYTARGAEPEIGFITGVSSIYVFVQFGTDEWSKATPPESIELEG